MERPNRAGEIISRTFFISQIVAIGLFGLTAAVADLSANDTLRGLLMVAGVATMVGVVWGFRLPADLLVRPSIQILQLGGTSAFGAFALALLANLTTAAVALRSSKQPGA